MLDGGKNVHCMSLSKTLVESAFVAALTCTPAVHWLPLAFGTSGARGCDVGYVAVMWAWEGGEVYGNGMWECLPHCAFVMFPVVRAQVDMLGGSTLCIWENPVLLIELVVVWVSCSQTNGINEFMQLVCIIR